MGYFDYLKGLLAPTGIYDLEHGAGAAELEIIGGELDEIFAELEELGREFMPCSAEGYGIELYEGLLPYRPAYITTKDAQTALMALLKIRGGCFTRERLQGTISGCGLAAVVEEGAAALTAVVSFPQNRGIPDGFEKLKARVEEILPCHLGVEYKFIYTCWRELMESFASWRDIEQRALTWREMEIYTDTAQEPSS